MVICKTVNILALCCHLDAPFGQESTEATNFKGHSFNCKGVTGLLDYIVLTAVPDRHALPGICPMSSDV